MRAKHLILWGIALLPPGSLKNQLYRRFFGYIIGKDVRIGLSLIDVQSVEIKDGVHIGNFNLIKGFERLVVNSEVHIGSHNRMIASPSYSWGSSLKVGARTSVTNRHYFDLTDSISLGDDVVVGGLHSQFWTHGFDVERHRLQGPIHIASNCYIGSGVIINLAVVVAERTMIGSGSVVTKPIPSGNGFYAGNPAKLIHDRIVLREGEGAIIKKTINGKNFFRRLPQGVDIETT